MARIRRDVWKLGVQPWNDTLIWYARGVHALRQRPIASPKSWTFFAAMHGLDEELWRAFKVLQVNDKLPTQADQDLFWRQCQHQTWYFLPWHRGYLAAFEATVRAAIIEAGGPADWALPYWNYSDSTDAKAAQLPAAFVEAHLPNGEANPLAESRRYGDGSGGVVINPPDVALDALKEPRFQGSASGGSTGFGGPGTPFRHGGPRGANGRLERQPHNVVHGLVGGRKGGVPDEPDSLEYYGLMSNPNTAALDPIFWLHHANIDRLWEVWLKRSGQNENPSADGWLKGPQDRRFAVPLPDGTTWSFSARDVLNTESETLDYVYDDTSDPFAGENLFARRLDRLGVKIVHPRRIDRELRMADVRPELIGANDETVRLRGDTVETRVRLDPRVTKRVFESLRPESITAGAAREPDRVFLNLENIRGLNDAAVFYVYVNSPGAKDDTENLVGVISLFGVRKATQIGEAHGGNGINESLEITELVDRLSSTGTLNVDDLKVRIVPRTQIRPEDEISVGRISIYREGR